jgi:hypothetical protein
MKKLLIAAAAALAAVSSPLRAEIVEVPFIGLNSFQLPVRPLALDHAYIRFEGNATLGSYEEFFDMPGSENDYWAPMVWGYHVEIWLDALGTHSPMLSTVWGIFENGAFSVTQELAPLASAMKLFAEYDVLAFSRMYLPCWPGDNPTRNMVPPVVVFTEETLVLDGTFTTAAESATWGGIKSLFR